MFSRLFLIRMEVIMNYVRRSFGAMALTFCGMLSLHADLATIVAPALDNGVVDVAGLNVALKLVAGRALAEVAAKTAPDDLNEVKTDAAITAKINALKDASTDVQDEVAKNAGFTTAEIIKINAAVAKFNAQIDALQAFKSRLPNNYVAADVATCVKAAKKVKSANMITVLKIAKYSTNVAAQKEAFLTLRDELKINKSADDILDFDPMVMSVEACPQDFLNYIAGFNKNVVAKIPTMTAKQAADAHKFALAQARIVARAARARNIQGIDCDGLDAQILNAKTDLKNRFDAVNEELVDLQAAALVKQTQPGLLSKAWSKVPSMPKLSMPKFSMSFFGSKNGGAVAPVNLFADVTETLNNLDATQENKVVILQTLRDQVQIIENKVTADDYNVDLQRESLVVAIGLVNNKFKQAFMNVAAVNQYLNAGNQGDTNAIMLAAQAIRLIVTVRNNVKNAMGDQLNELVELQNLSTAIYRALD